MKLFTKRIHTPVVFVGPHDKLHGNALLFRTRPVCVCTDMQITNIHNKHDTNKQDQSKR